MIPISALQSTAEDLMAKAAIEIPDDYLTGVRAAAEAEKEDLSGFVLQTMLDLEGLVQVTRRQKDSVKLFASRPSPFAQHDLQWLQLFHHAANSCFTR